MKCKRGIAAVCISAVLGCSALPAAALEPPAIGLQPAESVELSALAESEIEVHLKNETPLATETTYDNLQTFIAKAREQSDASDAEIAKTLLCRIGSADLAEAYTVEQLSEVLNYAGNCSFNRLLSGQPGRHKNAGHSAGGCQRKGTRAGRRQLEFVDELGNLG